MGHYEHVVLAFAIAAILAPFSYYAGHAARLLRMPQITGYLLSGIVCGPFLLGILSKESLTDLNVVEGACLAIIGLAAGSELDLPSLQRSRKQVLGITAGICIASWVFCFIAFDWVGSVFTSIMPTTDAPHVLAMATLGATLMMTRSPASAIAVLREVDSKGPFSSLVMAVVVVKDVVVVMSYALNIELIRAVVLPAHVGAGVQLINMVLPFLSVALSMTVGGFGGLLLGVLLRSRAPVTSGMLPSTHTAATETNLSRYKMAIILLLSTAVFQLSHYFDAEPLLACVTMGMVLVNRRHDRAEKDKEEVHALVSAIMSMTNVAFFGLAGASLKLSALKDMLAPALVVVIIRFLSISVGSWMGCYFTSTHPEHRRVFWASMVTQAGVALGLARLAGARFPDWGPHFQTYMMAIILINLIVGPPLFKWSLICVGEAKYTSQATGGQPGIGLGGAPAHPKAGIEVAGEKSLEGAASADHTR